ncbi:universal stress protein [Micromonospora polyrhachis]|uniref:Nucleotide-binding universal stress UspA family protein n=1 Tax=Micromonospora polyrhachis TaxID=1282883 RepID=A0A7W7SL98_9ACTN|nr:universal stress protein [Micromonospora polyrhachis]MBB4956878.1 nucleotide-binding universal stress UspA family protein [Micromonospora polyrhachis]
MSTGQVPSATPTPTPAHPTRPILVGYDGSDYSRAAVAWALDEGARSGNPVLLAYAFEWMTTGGWIGPGIGVGTWPDDVARREIEAVLREAVAEAATTHPGMDVRGEVFDGPPALILQERSANAALVVLGSRGHGGFTGLLAGSTTVSVAAHAHCPVVVVRNTEPGNPSPVGPVVVGLDGSEQSLLALDFAAERARSWGVPLRVARAWAPPASKWHPPEADLAQITVTEQRAVEKLLAGRLDRLQGVSTTVDVITEPPTAALVEASRGARLVVVGSRGRGGFRGLVLGSVSQQLMQHSHCPVAVVRELPPAGDGAGKSRS